MNNQYHSINERVKNDERESRPSALLVRIDPVRFPIIREACKFAASIIFIVNRASDILQVLQVRSDDHVAES